MDELEEKKRKEREREREREVKKSMLLRRFLFQPWNLCLEIMCDEMREKKEKERERERREKREKQSSKSIALVGKGPDDEWILVGKETGDVVKSEKQ